ncbi:hypothetical protein VPIG_00050 [Vibrio phage PWH3a-P1]|uniref:hypothetical protein n=1 Tax=Vibrio phage PWH3a-P1 TaxID=754058 RepID=UPI0002C12520|nr:hypothetical protein VPIG_00050 [Vibrio phage PWH3a-P1]AGH31908.1 hypothetical protein VPIG_00050 [Vibrio phage PWH3a-P1]
MTKLILIGLDQEDVFFINKTKIDVAKRCGVCQSIVDVFYSDVEQEYCIYIAGKWAGYYDIDGY